MDTKTLIKNLHQLFCNENKADKKYSRVWLSDVDFGGMYHTDRYVLNVMAEHEIDNCNDEIKEVLNILNEKAKEELEFIWRVEVYHSNDQYSCKSEDLIVYEEENACP